MIDLSDYYSGGYFLIRADKPDWPQLQTDLLPDKLISLSHLCPRLKVHWGWITGDRDAALRFGIPRSKLDEFIEWCGTEYRTDLDIFSMFYSPEAARRFIARFLPDTDGLYLIGAGLYNQLEEANWREPVDNGLGIYGIAKQITQHVPLADGGTPLGFDVASFSYDDFAHSWLCSYLHEDMNKLFDRTGQYGLLETREDAEKVYLWIEEDHQQGQRAEPEPFDYWLLVSYPLIA